MRATREQTPTERDSALGDCYKAAWEIVAFAPGRPFTLCHGTVTGRGPVEGVRFGHAWAERDGMAYDNANGAGVAMPVDLYYIVAEIDPAQVRRYTRAEALTHVLRTGHYGPDWLPGEGTIRPNRRRQAARARRARRK